MNWFKGSISEAVTSSKQKNATFVVYVEGKDDNSVKLTGFLDKPTIREKLEKDDFVAIKIEGGSEAYMQFARIYQIVPLPSLFFIGKNGTPLEIATGIIGSIDELERKIENVLKLTGKSPSNNAALSSEAFIAGEQKRDADAGSVTTATEETKKKEKTPTKEEKSPTSESKPISAEPKPVENAEAGLSSSPLTNTDTEVAAVVEPNKIQPFYSDSICFQEPNYSRGSENENVTDDAVPTPPCTPPLTDHTPVVTVSVPAPIPTTVPPTQAATPITIPPTPAPTPTTPPTVPSPTSESKVDHTKQLVEERRKLKEAEEERQERERELNRRKDGKNTQNVQQWQKEQDFKDVKESIRRERMEDQAARQRILTQIASDRAERANKFTPPAVSTTPTTQPTTPTTLNLPNNSDMSRIQFRIPNGETSTQTFESSDTFATVRAYVKANVLKGTVIKDFTLATTFPKHEFTAEDDSQTLEALGLAPSAVILVIIKASNGPSAVVARSGGVINVFNTIFWALLSPVMAVFGYLRNFIIGRNDEPADSRPPTTGTQKRANEERIDANDLAKKRNLDRFSVPNDGPSTSREAMATAANSTGGTYRRTNIHRLSDQRKDSDDENNTWNGNSTQQQ